MSRSLRRLPVALALVLGLGACTGSGDATQGSVRDDVREALVERTEDQGGPLDGEIAGRVADCVARGMFESGDFSPDERNEATKADDGDAPDDELVAKVTDLVERCEDEER